MIGIKLVAGIMNSDNPLHTFYDLNLKEALFKGVGELELFDFVLTHIKRNGVVPHRDTVMDKLGVKIPNTVPEPPSYYFAEMLDRHVHQSLKTAIISASDTLNNKDPHKAFEELKRSLLGLHVDFNGKAIVNYSEEAATIVTNEIIKVNQLGDDYGLKFGWPSLDLMSGGLIGGDVVSIIGRPAAGKTFLMLYAAYNAWKAKKVPLVVSMEMKPLPLVQRLAAIDASIPVHNIKTGQLPTIPVSQGKKLVSTLKDNKNKHPLWIIDGALTATVDDLILYCAQFNPDVVFIDGAYLLRSNNPKIGRWEKVTENAERIKSELAEALNIPVVISYQFNRKANEKKEGAPSVDDIAYTDAIGQLSSLVLGMMQPEGVETLNQRRIEIMKGRGGEVGGFDINWNFDKGPSYMDFSELENTNLEDLQFC